MITGKAGMDAHGILTMPDDATEDKIADEAYQMALNNAEMYGIYPSEEYPDEDFDEDLEKDCLSDNIEGWSIGEYIPELHDMYRPGGGSFKNDIDRYRTVL